MRVFKHDLEYERQASSGGHIPLTDNLVALFCAVVEVAQRGGGRSQGGQDAYWLLALKQLLRNAIDLIGYARRPLDFQSIYRVITSAPPSLDAVTSKAWQEQSECLACIRAIDVPDDAPESEDVALVENYWLREFPALAPETRSVIMSYFTSMADPFLRGVLKTLFSPAGSLPAAGRTSSPYAPGSASGGGALHQAVPELTHRGKIILIDLPVKQFNETGQFAQVLYKYIWQRATEKRNPNSPGQRPVLGG